MVDHHELWLSFCEENRVAEDANPLFVTNKDLIVPVIEYGEKGCKVLRRTAEMEEDLSGKAIEVRDDLQNGNPKYEGLLYMMFRKSKRESVVPLYIGKAERVGRKKPISGLFAGATPLPRWDNGTEYHIGALSTCVCLGYDKQKKSKMSWANALFEKYPSATPKLMFNVYLWVCPWRTEKIGLWHEYGPTSLCMQELMLINLAHRLFPDDVLNTEGILR